ncbi:MAG: SusC/RagA family TonB-linked outer membrane protein [Sphingobacteriales bacterium]|nr:SusC/RagA family TonB-linked outer membrane protein [Sphingobacteriales bacterium]
MTPKQLLAIIALPVMLLCSQAAYAQNKTISGKVTDSKDGAPISGASVQPKGTKKGVTTGADGSFKISVDANVTKLVISSVGYGSQEVDISGKSEISVSLTVTNTSLNEVVVVGYGTRKVKDATGSVAALSSKDFNKGVISTPEQLLQGRTPGVIVSPASGEPGAAATINIRGTSSIRGNQEPLYIIDGVPVTSSDGMLAGSSGIEGSSTPKNPLIFLNPNDIESMSILKDASATAIYGSRGANGVIIITTKSGKGKKGSFQFGASTSVSSIASRYDLLSPSAFLAAVKKANIDAGTSPAAAAVAVKNVDKGYNTDWQDQIYRVGVNQNYNLGWGFARKTTSLRLSGSYDDQQGIIKNSSLKRLTGRMNLTQKFLDDKLKFDINATYSNIKNSYPPLTNNAGYQGSLVGAVIGFNPTAPVFNPDGSYYDPKDGNRNPAEMLAYFDDKDVTNRFLTSVSGSYTITSGLVYKATLGYDNSKTERLSFADPRLSTNAFGGTVNVFGKDLGNQIEGNGRTTKQNLDLTTLLVEHTLTYDKTFKNGHVLNAVGGFSYQKTTTDYKGKVGWGLATPVSKPTDVFVKDFNNFKNYYDFVPGNSQYELQSYFGRVNYTIADKYLFTGTVRADGSSKFGKNNKYAVFPAFAAKWRLLKEGFAKGLDKTFSDLSIRANFGVTGSQEGIGPYDAVDLQQTWIGNSGQKETVLVHTGNPDLKWEQAQTTGVGIDFSLFNNRLTGTVDYYYTIRKDILFYGPTPGGFAPTSNWFINLPGKVYNRGVELGLNYKAIDRKNFKWEINYNMTFIKNHVEGLNVTVNTGAVSGQGLSGAYAQTFANGYPLFTWKMPTFLGFDGNGDARYANGGKDELQGSALPKFLAGLNNTFTWGKWSASVFVNTVRGFWVYNNTANALLLKGSIKTAHNVTYNVANSNEDPINPGSVSTRFLEKGDFIRLSNASLSYTFNMKSKTIHSLAVTLSGQNLALFTKYSGLDPEVNVDKAINGFPSRGFDYTGYPKPRTFTLGVNVGF